MPFGTFETKFGVNKSGPINLKIKNLPSTIIHAFSPGTTISHAMGKRWCWALSGAMGAALVMHHPGGQSDAQGDA
jgi:hypothetical protein